MQHAWCPYKKEKFRHTHTHREKVKMKAEVRAILLEAKEHQRSPAKLQKLGRGLQRICPHRPQKKTALLTA